VKASQDGSLSKYRYVHIAAHALSFPKRPRTVDVASDGAGSVNAAAGILTAAELANLKMGSELLVLAGCGTAAGRYEPGQGLLGFAFAALAAGNQAAVLSLWEVADDLTQRFMSGFSIGSGEECDLPPLCEQRSGNSLTIRIPINNPAPGRVRAVRPLLAGGLLPQLDFQPSLIHGHEKN